MVGLSRHAAHRSYAALSTGERHIADITLRIAAGAASSRQFVCIDEFTSHLDRRAAATLGAKQMPTARFFCVCCRQNNKRLPQRFRCTLPNIVCTHLHVPLFHPKLLQWWLLSRRAYVIPTRPSCHPHPSSFAHSCSWLSWLDGIPWCHPAYPWPAYHQPLLPASSNSCFPRLPHPHACPRSRHQFCPPTCRLP